MYLENEAGDGVLQSSINKACILQEYTQLTQNHHNLSGLSLESLEFFQNACVLNAGSEHSRSDHVFEMSRLHKNFIFGMLYWLVSFCYN